MTQLDRILVERCDSGRPFALATVLRAEGSTPVKAGAKAIVDPTGTIIVGTIGGGAVEGEAQRRAVAALRDGQPTVFDFKLQGQRVYGGGAICGGQMRVLVDPCPAQHRHAYAEAVAAREQRQRGALITTLRSAEPPQISVQWNTAAGLAAYRDFPGAEALGSVLRSERATFFVEEPRQAGTRVEVLVEPLVPPPMLLVVGGGHVGQAVVRQASQVGFEIVVLDDREEFTQPALFPPGVTARSGDIVRELAAFPFTPDTFVVLVSRGAEHDAVALAACIQQPVGYLGMIGSRRKVAMVRREFIESGRATAAEFDRVHAPIGLDLGAATVPEIAASIVAQLISVRRKGQAAGMPTT